MLEDYLMIITGKKTLEKFAKKHADSRKQITEWIHSVEETNWQRPNDIKRQYSTVSFLADNKVIFNICGNKHRLCVLVYYSGSVVHVKWVGTHAEYSKIKF